MKSYLLRLHLDTIFEPHPHAESRNLPLLPTNHGWNFLDRNLLAKSVAGIDASIQANIY
jgi:hypothetical protein